MASRFNEVKLHGARREVVRSFDKKIEKIHLSRREIGKNRHDNPGQQEAVSLRDRASRIANKSPTVRNYVTWNFCCSIAGDREIFDVQQRIDASRCCTAMDARDKTAFQ